MIEFKPSDFFHPGALVRTYWLMRRSEHWSSADFDRYQATHLARLMQHAFAQVPYYESLLAQYNIGAADMTPVHARQTLARVPVLDKDMLRAVPEQFIARNAQRYHPKALSTSGTTGTPLTVYWDKGSNVMEFCSIQRLWRWAGIRLGDPILDLRSRPITGQEKHLIRIAGISYIRNWKANALEFSSDLINDGNIQRYYDVLRRYRPKLVRGHPQAIQHLIELMQRHGLSQWQPIAVTTASEAIHDFQRQQIKSAWGLPVLDSYGLREHNVFIAQCPAGTYHIFPEYGICEILDDNNKPAAAGEEGWIVATGLHNYAQPLLRYNTRDRAVAATSDPCPCGRTLPAIKRIVGRIDDCVFTRDGHRYSGFSFAFFGRRGIRKARLVQEDLDSILVELAVTPEWEPAEATAIVQDLENKVERKLQVHVQIVDDIVQSEPGKFKFVVSKVGASANA